MIHCDFKTSQALIEMGRCMQDFQVADFSCVTTSQNGIDYYAEFLIHPKKEWIDITKFVDFCNCYRYRSSLGMVGVPTSEIMRYVKLSSLDEIKDFSEKYAPFVHFARIYDSNN